MDGERKPREVADHDDARREQVEEQDRDAARRRSAEEQSPETARRPVPGVKHEPEPDAGNIMPAENEPGTL